MATLVFTTVITAKYKETSENLNSAKKNNVRKKTMNQIMQESFFHGRGWMGSNFIA